jgi:hypothetical protein
LRQHKLLLAVHLTLAKLLLLVLVALAVNFLQKLFLLLFLVFAICVEAQLERYQKLYLFHWLQKCHLVWECQLVRLLA